MGKLTVKEMLDHPEMSQFIMPQNCNLFVLKPKDYEELVQLAHATIIKSYQEAFDNKELVEDFEMNYEKLISERYTKAVNEVFKEHSSKINTDKLMLYIAMTSIRTLQALNRTYSPEKASKNSEEVFFANGDYIVVKGQEAQGRFGGKDRTKMSEIQDRLARVVLIAADYFSGQKNKKYLSEISGAYYHYTEENSYDKVKFNEKELVDFARSIEIITSLSTKELSRAVSEGLISKNTIINHFAKGKMPKELSVEYLNNGIISDMEFAKKIYGKNNINEVAEDPKTDKTVREILFLTQKTSQNVFEKTADFSLALKAYVLGRIDIEAFQNLIKNRNLEPDPENFPNDLNTMAKLYQVATNEQIVTSISELLTHNIMDYKHSMEYLRFMQDKELITEDDKNYIEQLMQDFKTNELINDADNELVEVLGASQSKVSQSHTSNLTIDPGVRINYLTSLGAVKKVKVRGETFIKDTEEASKKRNSLDGYEMFIIPSKKIAVLEKLYETTRDKKGNIVYRKNKQGELIPAVENATYIMPIEMAKEFTEKKNKRELIASPYVERSMHTADWSINTERRIAALRPGVEFNKENSQKWTDIVRENYQKNKGDMIK